MSLRSSWARLLSPLSVRHSAQQSDADFEEEIAAHLQLAADELKARGMEEREAQRQARLRFGGVTPVRELRRMQRGFPLLPSIAADLRFASRQLRRAPGFSLLAVLSLAVGIGATTAIYSLLDSILLRPLPFAEQQELVKVSGFYPKGWIRAVQGETHSLSSVLGYSPSLEYNIQTSVGPERVFASGVTTNAFAVLGVRPQLGRFFLPGEAVAGQDKVVVLSDGYWRQSFGAAPGVVGQTLRVDGEPRTIVGVMPAGIPFPDAATRFWLPISFKSGDPIDAWAQFTGQMIGRLRPGATPAQVQAELRTLHPQLLRLFPWPMPDNWYADVTATPLLDAVGEEARPKLLLLFAAVALLLLITCANVANLMLARAAGRTREIAVRSALGASGRRLMRQMLTESLLLGLLAGGLGSLLAAGGLHALKGMLPAETPRLAEAGLHPHSFLLIAGLSVATGLLFGLAPALRVQASAVAQALKANEMAQSSTREQFRFASMLVVGQVALAVVVIVGAGLLLHSFWRLVHVDPGFRTAGVVTARVALADSACGDNDAGRRCTAFFHSLLERSQTLPGVQDAAVVSTLPMTGYDEGYAFDVEDHSRSPRQTPDQGSSRTVSPGYFHLLGVRLLRGRLLNQEDEAGTSRAVVVNQQMADRYWPGQNALGKRVEWVGKEGRQGVLDKGAFTIVGVVSNTRHESLDTGPGYEMYVPMAPGLVGAEMSLLWRSAASAEGKADAMRGLVHSLDPSVPVLDMQALEDVVQVSASSERSLTMLLFAFAGLALGVGMVGVYSLIAYTVHCRTREMGIRLALGATRSQIAMLVLRQGLTLVGTGCLLGLAAAAMAGRLLRSFLFATSPLDPAAFALVPVLLLVLAVVAASEPARHAARIEPMESLRGE